MKKFIAVMVVICVCFSSMGAYAEDNARIKRLIAGLYDKKTAMDSQRKLTSYGPEVTEYLVPVLSSENKLAVRIAALRIIG